MNITCEDCKYYGKEVNIDDKTYHLCTDSGDLMTAEEEDDMFAMCGRFENNDGTYHHGTEHCGRCGRPTNAWGLCDECSRIYDSWDEVSK